MLWRLWILHAALLLVFVVDVTPFALGLCAASLWLRIFGLTAGYHRLFAHRSFQAGRVLTFLLAWLGASSGQRGPLWWAAHHRRHHQFSDRERDPHSPLRGRLFAHLGWVLPRDSLRTDERAVADWLKFPELRWLNRFHVVAPVTWAFGCFFVGGAAGFVWSFVVATIAGVHIVSAVNSLAHASSLGSRAFATSDQSRNIWWLALPTLGDAWHNNHHASPRSARHGFRWYEVDVTYAVLRALSVVGLVWDLRERRLRGRVERE